MKLYKSQFTLSEVTKIIKEIEGCEHIDDVFIQRQIANGNLNVKLTIENCFLLPVSGIGNDYSYIELIANDHENKITSLSLFVDVNFNKKEYLNHYQIVSYNELENTSNSLIPFILTSDKLNMLNSCCNNDNDKGVLEPSMAINVECGLMVSPLSMKAFREIENKAIRPDFINFSSPEEIEEFEDINLSRIKRNGLQVEDKIKLSNVVDFNGKKFYVANLRDFNQGPQAFRGFSLSDDVAKAFDKNDALAVSKEDLLEFIGMLKISNTSMNTEKVEIDTHSKAYESKLFTKLSSVIDEFEDSEIYLKYGEKVQMQMIKDWLKEKYEDLKGRELEVSSKMIAEAYRIKSLRS